MILTIKCKEETKFFARDQHFESFVGLALPISSITHPLNADRKPAKELYDRILVISNIKAKSNARVR